MDSVNNLFILVPIIISVLMTVQAVFHHDDTGTSLSYPLTNMKCFDNKLYIGGKNELYILNKDLSISKRMSTCSSQTDCGNINVILEVLDENSLITCGTGNGGFCELRNLNTLEKNDTSSEQGSLKVSSNMKRPAQVIVSNDDSCMMAATYGAGFESKTLNIDETTYDYAISTWKLKDGKFELERGEKDIDYKKVNILIKDSIPPKEFPLEQYVIYYKDSFQHNWNSYFVTNQKNFVGGSKYVSKLVRLCQNDTGLFSYTDILIECKDGDGNIYNLIQNVIKVDDPTSSGKTILIGIFTKGNDPEKKSGESVICSVMLDVLDDLIMKEKEKFATNCSEVQKAERYLPDKRRNKCISAFSDEFFECKLKFPYLRYTIGEAVGNFTQVYKLNAGDGILTSLHSYVLNGDRTVIIAGTTTGKIIRMNLHFGNTSLTLYDSTVVDSGADISRICNLHDDDLYVMTERKISKLDSSNCSEFTTCKATMKGKNPICGWCVFKNRATRKSNCTTGSNHWLPSFGECIQLDLNPKGIPVIEDGRTEDSDKIRILATGIPGHRTGDTYKCVFMNGLKRIKMTVAIRVNNTFTCETPQVSSHTIAVLELVVAFSTGNITLAKADFLFYDCRTYMKCGECVNTKGTECGWSVEQPGCGNRESAGIKKEVECPKLEDNIGVNFIPRNIDAQITLVGSNLPNSTGLKFWCYIPTKEDAVKDYFEASVHDSNITCRIKIDSKEVAKTDVRVLVKYGETAASGKELDDQYRNNVTVYDCGKLADDCSHCKALNKTRYDCYWCSRECLHENKCDEKCPVPTITRILPKDGPIEGNTKVTIDGTELGTNVSDIDSVKIGTTDCVLSTNVTDFKISLNGDFDLFVPNCIVCRTGKVLTEQSEQVHVTVNDLKSYGSIYFAYKKVTLTDISPKFGPMVGGTLLTLNGENLGVGNRHVTVILGSNNCTDAEVKPMINLDAGSNVNFTIQCRMKTVSKEETRSSINTAFISIDEVVLIQGAVNFTFLPNPEIEQISPKKGTVSGGTGITVTGKNMNNTHVAKIEGNFKGEKLKSSCEIQSSTKTVCRAPNSTAVKNMVEELIKSPRRKRSDCSACKDVEVKVYLDGFEKEFTLTYYRDPSIHPFEEKDKVHLFSDESKKLTIRGEYINLVAQESDVNITIGLETCSVFELKENLITCLAPKEQPASRGSTLPEVNVTIGNYNKRVGFLKYEKTVEMILIIAGAVGGGLLAIIIIGVVFGIYKYKKVGKKAKEYERNLSDMEMEIKRVAREEFLDMHTTMSSVNKNLVEQGFPYHGYQQFACNVMFSVDYLWTEPVMTDDERLKANKGMESLESLISNKFFLVSVITTMENEKRFFIREKSNLAGNLCAVLMGRMDYLNEILKLLMTNLVQESSTKKHKTLFRRCESITEKLLSNWLSLCLYPHIKSHSGSPLYLLYMATQKTMESGPIDAVTGDAKYTLSEEKLLKKWSSSVEEDDNHDLKFEAKTLTLNVVVDNGEEIFKCKALDCDTVSQVKSKCLNQIYVNYPASQLPVGADDLALEWHEGFGGALRLRDEDNTSKREGHWVRLNTLAHYNVKDESNMALIDPHSAEINNQEDYVNLANINMEGVCDGSIDSSQPLTPHDEENPHEFEHWHLVKKEEESAKQGKSAIAELYLNRLFTTKQSLMEYMRPLFDLILDHDRCPPPTKFLYDFLDELGEKYKVETDTVHAWKSHSYAIRVWASLMKMPNTLFDVAIPSFMEENLNIISQVFIESFSLASQKFTKDSPSQKLIFHHEMNHYRDRVKEFYKNVKVDSQNSEEFRQYMAEVNRLQQQTNFNKVSALYRFYNQLKPYFEDILENLSKSKEASTLQLDRKLEQVIAIMEEED